MTLFHIHIPGVKEPHSVLAIDENAAIADALYVLGLHSLPEGSSVTSELHGEV